MNSIEMPGDLFSAPRVLVVEDGPSDQRLLKTLLQTLGANLTLHSTCRAACEEIVRREPDAFDLVLLDLKVPQIDGIEAIAQMRAAQCASDIVGLVRVPSPRLDQVWRRAGGTRCLAKPVSLTMLAGLVAPFVPAA